MAKGQTERSAGMASDNYTRNLGQGQQTQGKLWDQVPGAQQRTGTAYDAASGAYTGALGGTGSYDPTQFKQQSDINDANMKSGGYNPENLSKLRGQQDSNIATGGYDPATMAKLKEGYGGMISNGGIDDATAGAMERKAASSAQSNYATLGANLTRTGTAQGVNAGGETAEMARHAAQDSATATTGAEAQIGQLRQTGKIAGLGGASNLAGSEAANRLAATGQAASTEASVASGSLTASKVQQDLISGVASQRMQAAGGLAQLYQAQPAYVNTLIQQIMQSQSQTGQLTTEQAQIMAELSKNPGLAQTILGDVAMLAGGAGGLMTGIGSL